MNKSNIHAIIFGFLIMSALVVWFAVLWQNEKKNAAVLKDENESLVSYAKESALNSIKQAKTDSARYVKQYDSAQTVSRENAKKLLHDINQIHFTTNSQRKHYADSLQSTISR